MKKTGCFLDRDGVINEEVNYLHEPDKVVILPGVVPALRLLRENGFVIMVVTNQAGVARGLYPTEDIDAVHQRISELLAPEGVAIDGFFYCPHHEKFTGPCLCRKPEPGMLQRAAQQFDVDPARSLMIGDRPSDIGAGAAFGCRANYLVRTGYGEKVIAENNVPSEAIITDDVLSAVQDFLKRFH